MAPPDNDVAAVAHDVALEAVSFTYTDRRTPRARTHQLHGRGGEMVGVMGASGAGKSTLAKCLNRIVPELRGRRIPGVVRIGGRSIDGRARMRSRADESEWSFRISRRSFSPPTWRMRSPSRWSRSGCRARRSSRRIGPALEAVGLAGFEDRDPTSLSGGEKQRLAIASVLALSPSVVVLDEPTTDLDPEGKAEVFALIRSLREQGLSLIVIEHEAEELRDCDRIVLLRDGEMIAEGAPHDLMTRLELLEECGVHPPDLNRVLAKSGIAAHARSVDEAEALIRRALPNLAAARPSSASTG